MRYSTTCNHCGAVIPIANAKLCGPQGTYTLCPVCADAYALAEACEMAGCPDADDCQCAGHNTLREREGCAL